MLFASHSLIRCFVCRYYGLIEKTEGEKLYSEFVRILSEEAAKIGVDDAGADAKTKGKDKSKGKQQPKQKTEKSDKTDKGKGEKADKSAKRKEKGSKDTTDKAASELAAADGKVAAAVASAAVLAVDSLVTEAKRCDVATASDGDKGKAAPKQQKQKQQKQKQPKQKAAKSDAVLPSAATSDSANAAIPSAASDSVSSAESKREIASEHSASAFADAASTTRGNIVRIVAGISENHSESRHVWQPTSAEHAKRWTFHPRARILI